MFLAASSNTYASASSHLALSHSPCRPSSTAALKSALLCAPGSRFGRAGAGHASSSSGIDAMDASNQLGVKDALTGPGFCMFKSSCMFSCDSG